MLDMGILTGGVSFILASVVKLVTIRMKMKHQEQKALLQKAGIVQDAREYGSKDEHFAFTRRVIAFAMVVAFLCPVWAPFIGYLLDLKIAVAVPLVDESKTKLLWGIFSYQDTVINYKYLTNPTWLPEFNQYVGAIIGLYFGSRK